MLLPRAGQCKFCATRLGAGWAVAGAERLGEEHGAATTQFPCPYCNARMVVVLHPHAVVEFKGALEELVVAAEEEPAIRPPVPPRPAPNVWGDDNRLRNALKRSRQTRQALKQTAPPSTAQVVYKKA